MSAYVANSYRRIERQGLRALDAAQAAAGQRPTFRWVYGGSEDPLVAPAAQACNSCGTTRDQHQGLQLLCPEWALREAWGR